MALESFRHDLRSEQRFQKLLAELGFDNVVVAGDTRFDRVAEIAAAAIDIERFKGGTRLLIAGSTWNGRTSDLALINDNPSVKFIVAPRNGRKAASTACSLKPRRSCPLYAMHRRTSFDGKQLSLDTVGILSSAHGYAEWGGGRRRIRRRHHNTPEAATFGLPIAFGPQLRKNQGSLRPGNASERQRPSTWLMRRRTETWFTPALTTSIFNNAAASPKTTRRPTISICRPHTVFEVLE